MPSRPFCLPATPPAGRRGAPDASELARARPWTRGAGMCSWPAGWPSAGSPRSCWGAGRPPHACYSCPRAARHAGHGRPGYALPVAPGAPGPEPFPGGGLDPAGRRARIAAPDLRLGVDMEDPARTGFSGFAGAGPDGRRAAGQSAPLPRGRPAGRPGAALGPQGSLAENDRRGAADSALGRTGRAPPCRAWLTWPPREAGCPPSLAAAVALSHGTLPDAGLGRHRNSGPSRQLPAAAAGVPRRATGGAAPRIKPVARSTARMKSCGG